VGHEPRIVIDRADRTTNLSEMKLAENERHRWTVASVLELERRVPTRHADAQDRAADARDELRHAGERATLVAIGISVVTMDALFEV
jgi:hypothetical protein